MDLGTRAVLPYLTQKRGVPVNVVNKPGVNSVPAMLEVYNPRPDGYTLFADCQNFSSLLPFVVKDQEFISKLKNAGFAPFYLNSHDTKEHVRKEMEEAIKF